MDRLAKHPAKAAVKRHRLILEGKAPLEHDLSRLLKLNRRHGDDGGRLERMPASDLSKTAVVAILAGGEGRRLGGGKPTTRLAGRPLISHPLEAATTAGLRTVVVAKRRTPLPRLPCEILYEPDSQSHPLCGITTALSVLEEPVLAVACDMPFLTASLLDRLARLDGPAVVSIDGELEPLLARWTPAQLPALEAALSVSLPLRATIASLEARLRPRVIDEAACRDLAMARFNVNDRADVAAAEAMLLAMGDMQRNGVSGRWVTCNETECQGMGDMQRNGVSGEP